MRKALDGEKHTKGCLSAESTAATDNAMTNQIFLRILQYNIRKSLKIQKSFLIDREVREINITVIQEQSRKRFADV